MARRSFKSLVACFSAPHIRIIWLFWTYCALRIFVPTLVAGHGLIRKPEATELDRLLYDLTRVWEITVIPLCLVLTFGSFVSVGFVLSSHTQAKWIQVLYSALSYFFFLEAFVYYSTRRILDARGADTIAKHCEGVKPENTASIRFGGLCHRPMNDFGILGYALLLIWLLFRLCLLFLTESWLLHTRKQEAEARAKIERDVQEGASQGMDGPIRLTGEEEFGPEDKV